MRPPRGTDYARALSRMQGVGRPWEEGRRVQSAHKAARAETLPRGDFHVVMNATAISHQARRSRLVVAAQEDLGAPPGRAETEPPHMNCSSLSGDPTVAHGQGGVRLTPLPQAEVPTTRVLRAIRPAPRPACTRPGHALAFAAWALGALPIRPEEARWRTPARTTLAVRGLPPRSDSVPRCSSSCGKSWPWPASWWLGATPQTTSSTPT